MAEPKSKEEAKREWWAAWWAADYSWEGLANKLIQGSGQFGEATLQDYWRRDPETGKVRTDAALKKVGELVAFAGTWWHVAHLPLRDQTGETATWKTNDAVVDWRQLDELIGIRIANARETPGEWGQLRKGERGWVPEAVDRRAQLAGTVCRPAQILPQDEASLLNMSCAQAWLVGDTVLSGRQIGPGLDFHRATFSGDASFYSATFSGYARFDSATFSGDASFYSATFSGDASFDSATFSGDARFDRATFSGYARFDRATFSGDASFDRATFSGDASFYSATFKSRFVMSGRFETSESAPNATTSFREAVFEGPVVFSAKVVDPERRFSGAFYGAQFLGIANFSGAVGSKQAGRLAAAFGEAQFEKALILTDGLDSKAGDGLHKTLIAGAKAAATNEMSVNERLAQLESGCRTIKIAMGKARDEVREQAYYRLQLRARHARTDIGKWEKGIGWLYGFSSDFGSSLSRPCFGLLGLIILSGTAYFAYASYLGIPAETARDAVWHGQSLALRSAFQPFSILALDPTAAATAGAPKPTWLALLLAYSPAASLAVRVFSLLQSIFGGVLIFLFAVAVRRRFQIS